MTAADRSKCWFQHPMTAPLSTHNCRGCHHPREFAKQKRWLWKASVHPWMNFINWGTWSNCCNNQRHYHIPSPGKAVTIMQLYTYQLSRQTYLRWWLFSHSAIYHCGKITMFFINLNPENPFLGLSQPRQRWHFPAIRTGSDLSSFLFLSRSSLNSWKKPSAGSTGT